MTSSRSTCTLAHFAGIFANASLFHVPSSELARVLRDLATTLKDGGVLFCSIPRGSQRVQTGPMAATSEFTTTKFDRTYVTAARFRELHHYYRPPGQPRAEQP